MKARVTAFRNQVVGSVGPRMYGSFVEHLGRAVYAGIYEPTHPSANAEGMRGDVIDLVRELGIGVVRYPGGNFVSGYNWEDGIGPRHERPTRIDLTWRTSDDNAVGIHEFASWCEAVGTELMLAVNLGTRGLDEARHLLEYVNHPGGSALSDLRKRNGREEPWNVRLWCLGNELDGWWQVGKKSAEAYARLATDTARTMKHYDKNLELVVCGSSNPDMDTYPEWEAIVLDESYELVDYISLHRYLHRTSDTKDFLALTAGLDRYISEVSGIIRYTKAKKRSSHNVYISFDEWNVWYHSTLPHQELAVHEDWVHAPSILEEDYNAEDVLLVACVLNTFMRHADIVKMACIAQLINVLSPISTVTGGIAWRRTIFYPLYFASKYGTGMSLQLVVDVEEYESSIGDRVPYLDVAAILRDDEITFFVVNRHQTESLSFECNCVDIGARTIISHDTMAGPLNATNTACNPDTVRPVEGRGMTLEGQQLFGQVGPLSYHVIRLGVEKE